MDDSLAEPRPFEASPAGAPDAENDNEEMDEEEDGLDWSSVPAPNSTRAQSFIPRRGEKDFEPRNTTGTGTGTKLQQHLLDKSRNAMFTALSGARGTNSRSMSHAVWLPGLARAHVIHARGKHFATLGASISRDGSKKHLELLPEEALYLFERGSLFCWRQSSPDAVYPEELEDGAPAPGQPMSVQQGYAEMLGHENLSLDHYQVYAYLKRLGYNVLRTSSRIPPPVSWWRRCISALLEPFRAVRHRLASFLEIPLWKRRDWWRPRLYHGWLFPRDYQSLFSRLQFIPRGHGIPLNSRYTDSKQATSPYKIFFDVYKPAFAFRRTDDQRPAPSFQVVVINARTTPVPTIYELTTLFNEAQDWPEPPPKQKVANSGNKGTPSRLKGSASGVPTKASTTATVPPTPAPSSTSTLSPNLISSSASGSSWWASLVGFLRLSPVPVSSRLRKPNPFVQLKNGTKSIVVAVVDAGTITCYRFNRGDFASWPMLPS